MITLRQLQEFLNQNSGNNDWQWDKPLMIHNIETGDEYTTDTLVFTNNYGVERLVLGINSDEE
jgi:phage-related protein